MSAFFYMQKGVKMALDQCQASRQYLRVLNSSYHNIKIITYQQLLAKAKNSLSLLMGNLE